MKKCSAFISINFSFIIQMKYTLEQSRVPPELILFFSYVGILFRILSRYTYILFLLLECIWSLFAGMMDVTSVKKPATWNHYQWNVHFAMVLVNIPRLLRAT